MKYPLLTKSAFLLFAAGAMAGCSDSEEGLLPSSRPAKPGETILFGIDGPATTRTHYTEDSLQIDWDLKDKIVIYSEQAARTDGEHHAFYMIDNVYPEDDPIHQFHGDFVPVASEADNDTTENYGVGLKWTEGDGPNGFASEAYTFYGAYPAQRYQSVAETETENGTFTMDYITNQVNTVVSVNNGKYETEPDMLNAYMMAKKTVKPQEDHVLLSFDPIMTTLKIDVTAGGYELGTGIIQPITVTGVSVMMPRVIAASEFSYRITADHTDGDPTASRGELKNTLKDGKESVFVGILQDDKRYVELNEGETISLMAFLPPIKGLKMSELKVKIHTAEGFDFVTSSTSGADLKEQSRIYIHLPDVSVYDKKNNNWISQLDGNIKLPELSIPGYQCDGSENGNKINELLQKGIRVFDIEALTTWGNENNLSSVRNALNTFITKEENKEEFIFATVEGWGDFPKDFKEPTIFLKNENWQTTTVSQLRGNIIPLAYYARSYFIQDGGYGTNEYRLFQKNTYPHQDANFENNSAWHLLYKEDPKDFSYSKTAYEIISNNSAQNGRTGIVMVPCADQPYVDGEYTYSDLLIQSIIDCNFKFILDRAN